MVLFLTTTLAVSIVGMVTLLGVKRYELSTGRMVFNSLRPLFNFVFHRSFVFLEHILPSFLRMQIERVVFRAAGFVQRTVAHGILMAEYWLERALNALRMTTHIPHPSIPASAFLREVAEHKKSLLKRSRRERLIVHK